CPEVGVSGVEGEGELAGIAAGLGEDEPALNRGEGGGRESARVGSAIELPALLHGLQAPAKRFLPARERVGEGVASLLVGFGELTDERSDRAASASAAGDLQLDERIEPGADGLPAVERAEVRFLGGEHELRVVCDDVAQQRCSVVEVEVELALADACG